jgi:predicted Rossmann-fold nucleotide-binding protein
MLTKIVTGGQTGVDRAALDVAIELNYKYGGWCPRGRKAEDGVIDPIKYANLEETSTDHYPQRTKFNVRDSDGTLIIIIGSEDAMGVGSKLTATMAKKYEKPLLIVNLNDENKNENDTKVIEWLSTNNIETLNIAGPREETTPGIYKEAEKFLRNLLQKLNS